MITYRAPVQLLLQIQRYNGTTDTSFEMTAQYSTVLSFTGHWSVSMCVCLCLSEACAGSKAGAWEPVFQCLYLLGSVSLSVCLRLCVFVCLCLSEACAGSSAGAWESRAG